jgi:hypothetical protein
MTETPDIADRLESAGLPADNLLNRRTALPGPAAAPPHPRGHRNHRNPAYQRRAGRLGQQAGHRAVPGAARSRQRRAGLHRRRRNDGHRGVPFAANNISAHRVRISNGPAVAANCAVDALGIPAMLGRDAEIHSTDPHSGEPVVATSREGTWQWQPESGVVFVGSNGSGPLTQSCCPVINFFTDEDKARAYQGLHHLEGDVLTMAEAAEAGALVFGDLLTGRETT